MKNNIKSSLKFKNFQQDIFNHASQYIDNKFLSSFNSLDWVISLIKEKYVWIGFIKPIMVKDKKFLDLVEKKYNTKWFVKVNVDFNLVDKHYRASDAWKIKAWEKTKEDVTKKLDSWKVLEIFELFVKNEKTWKQVERVKQLIQEIKDYNKQKFMFENEKNILVDKILNLMYWSSLELDIWTTIKRRLNEALEWKQVYMFLLPKQTIWKNTVWEFIGTQATTTDSEIDLEIRKQNILKYREIAWPTIPSPKDNTIRWYVARKYNLITEPLYQALKDKAIDNGIHISWDPKEWLEEIELWCRYILSNNNQTKTEI